jgi:hypothetical protein
MVLHASFFVCFAFTAACLLYLIVYSFIRERTPDVISFDQTIDRLRLITKEFLELQQLQGKEREALCRQIAALIREDSRGLLDFIHQACSAGPPKDGEIRELMRVAHVKGLGVYWKISGILFLLRFRPALARDCRRVTEAAVQHAEAWLAFIRLLRAQYPAETGHLEMPE